jgi:hypothetical protein
MKKRLFKLAGPILGLPRPAKRIVVLLIDCGLCILAVWLAYYLRLGEIVALSGHGLWAAVSSICIALPIFIVSGLYRAIFRYSGRPALISVAKAVGVYGVLYVSIFTAIGVRSVPRTVGIIQPILLLLLVGASRAFARFWLLGQKCLSTAQEERDVNWSPPYPTVMNWKLSDFSMTTIGCMVISSMANLFMTRLNFAVWLPQWRSAKCCLRCQV